MVNKAKIVGSNWERDLVDIFNKKLAGANFRRVPGSGAIGTSLDEPLLTGDVVGTIESFYKKFRIECKAGYNTSSDKEVKQFSLKKVWLDKIASEANLTNAMPFLAGKFTGARSGVKHFVVMDLEVFIDLLNEYSSLKEDYDKLFIASLEGERGHLDSAKKTL